MTCVGWCGRCYAGIRGRAVYKGHAGYRPAPVRLWRDEAMALRKPSGGGGGVGHPAVDLSGTWLAPFPHVRDFLCVPVWDDGSPRQVGSITLFCDEGRMKACANDKDAMLMCFVSGESLESVFAALEAVLASGGGDWRAMKQGPRTARRS
jgi:hypothetical protein